MAIKGLRVPVFGKYGFDGNKVTYTGGFVCGKAVEYGVELDTGDDNPLYADDGIAENDYGVMTGGTLTLNTTDLDQQTTKALLGVKEIERTVGEKKVTELVYDDDAKSEPMGFGVIEVHQINNVDKYRAVILAKITPKIPPEAATTKGEAIEWQTKEIECSIGRSEEDSEKYKHPWKYEAWFDTAAEAMEYLKEVLGVTDVEQVSRANKMAKGEEK